MTMPRPLLLAVARALDRWPLPLERWPDSRLLWFAQRLIDPRPLGWFPGWRFSFGYASTDPIVRLRKRIWQHFADRRQERAIVAHWYDDLKVWLYLGNDQSWALFVGGAYEPNSFAFLARVLKRGMTFVDVGANDGLFSLFAAGRVGEEGRVLAIEPSEREFKRLNRNLVLNRLRNVRPHRMAAAERPGELRLQIAGYGHEGHNTLGSFIYDTTLARTETVQATSLDDLIADAGLPRVDVIKIDVEGAEFAVLEGARTILDRDRPVLVIELCDATLRTQGRTAAEALGLLRAYGYRIYVFDSASGRPRPGEVPPQEDSNIVAIPPSQTFDPQAWTAR